MYANIGLSSTPNTPVDLEVLERISCILAKYTRGKLTIVQYFTFLGFENNNDLSKTR
jgi:hypothetical protein